MVLFKSHYRYSDLLLQDYEFRRRVRAGAILTNQMIRRIWVKRGKKSSFREANILLTGSVVAVDGSVGDIVRVKYPSMEKLFQLKSSKWISRIMRWLMKPQLKIISLFKLSRSCLCAKTATC